MIEFKNILFVVNETYIPDYLFSTVAKLSSQYGASFSFLALHTPFPSQLKDTQQDYETSIQDMINKGLKGVGLKTPSAVRFISDKPHFVGIVNSVLQEKYDLVCKAAEQLEANKKYGFQSLDMNLLRKCPCPLWLFRESYNDNQFKILSAIDAFADTKEGQDLNVKLLELGQSLSAKLGAKHSVLSCWDYEYENYLRSSPFAKMPEAKIDALVQQENERHETMLGKIIEDAEIDFSQIEIIRQKGKLSDIVPIIVAQHKIDSVLMGTVGRTGIPGFVIGNTAENTLHATSCGLLAVKPNGFISPIEKSRL